MWTHFRLLRLCRFWRRDPEAAQLAKEQVLATAVSDCGLTSSPGVNVGDSGRTVTLDGKGAEDVTGQAIEELVCVLVKVHTPDVVMSKLESTRALAGRQSATWDNIEASWTYQPDAGMEVTLTTMN